MPPLHRSLSFQISEAFNEMWNRKSSKYKKYGYYDNGGEIGENENVQYWFNYNYSLTKSISCDFQKRGKFRQYHSSHNTINRTNTLPKRFGEINYHQPTWRYWGEEKVDGAIYTVYLKKVRYHTPTKSVSVDTEDDISHLEWETVRVRFIKAGTLGRLVESLASDTGELESTYISVFLATYRTFSSPKQVLNLLIERYEFLHNCGNVVEERPNNSEVTTSSPPPPPPATPRIREDVRDQHCKTLRLALHVWLDQFPEDFRDPPNYPCLSQLEAFCQKIMPGSELDEKVRRKGIHIRRPPPPPPPSSLCSLPPPGLDHKKSSRHKSPPPLVLKSSHTSPMGGTGSSTDRSASPLPPPPLVSRGGTHGGGGHHGPITGSNGAPPLPPKPVNRNGLPVAVYTDILDIPDQIFAQQLTRMDCELFKRVIPHQCLGSVWSRRDKSSRDRDAATVVATVDQFNAVSFRVISTVLMVSGHSNCHSHIEKENYKAAQHRARVITKWIDIAQELRVLKNFSSLKAIISGLQSNPVYRLTRSWSHVPKDKLQIYEELARIFSEDNNALAQRELLVREGTARFADTVGANDHQMQKILQKHSENSRAISYGTIPYLGTFLTDLTMIDTAIGDVLPDGLINFDKRRKEFEVLAQIKLLQGAANAYQIEKQEHFVRWFESVLLLDERQAFELSCQIELQQPTHHHSSSSSTNDKFVNNNNNNYSSSVNSARENKYKKNKQSNGNYHHRKNDSIASTASSSSGSQFYYDTDTPSLHSNPAVTGDKVKHEGTNTHNNKELLSSSSKNDILEEEDDESNACEDSVDQGTEKQNDAITRRGSRGSYLSSVSSSCGSCSLDASLASSSNVARSEPNAHSTPLRNHVKPSSTKSAGAESDSKHTGKSSENPLGDIGSSSSVSSASRKASQLPTTTESPYKTSEFYIIRVSIESPGPATEGVIMYKSIMVANHERTGSVIRSAMMKHGLEGSPDNYTLSQLLPDKELLIPAKANVYYAINTQHDLNFILKEKENNDKDDFLTNPFASPPGGSLFDRLNDTSSNYGATPKGTRKPARDTSKARRKLLGLTL